ncbi:MAG: transposase zinc-binding domain-containing protein, partial [Candidatus Ozemobacteraceae bacterium]
MTTIADIVRAHGKEHLQQFGADVPARHRKALRDIAACHTPEMGGHLYLCENCGEEHIQYHSCRIRSCPSCQGAERRAWVDARLADVLPCRYFHLVFTVPATLNRLIRSNQEILLDALMRAVGDSLREMAGNPEHLGGRIGVLEVLHTWGGNLEYHPHVHCLVPRGAWRTDGRIWTSSSSTFFLPVKALSGLFRGKFLTRVKAAFPGMFPEDLWDQEWVVFSKPVIQGPEKV